MCLWRSGKRPKNQLAQLILLIFLVGQQYQLQKIELRQQKRPKTNYITINVLWPSTGQKPKKGAQIIFQLKRSFSFWSLTGQRSTNKNQVNFFNSKRWRVNWPKTSKHWAIEAVDGNSYNHSLGPHNHSNSWGPTNIELEPRNLFVDIVFRTCCLHKPQSIPWGCFG